MIQCKRVYEQAAPEDGYRVLVDRLWPRGVKKQTLCMMNGAKRLRLLTGYVRPFTVKPLISLPSAAYGEELAQHKDEGLRLATLARQQTLTLLYAAKIPNRITQ